MYIRVDIFVIDTRTIRSLERESRTLISSGRREKYGRAFASGIREHNGIILSIVSGGGCGGAIWGGLGDTRVCMCTHERAVCTRATTGRWTGDIASRYVGYARYAGTMFWFWSVRQIRSPFVTEARAFETRERKGEREKENHHRTGALLPTACPPFYSPLRPSSLDLIRGSSCERKVVRFVWKSENMWNDRH